jgi:hypothetical protein
MSGQPRYQDDQEPDRFELVNCLGMGCCAHTYVARLAPEDPLCG